MTVQCEHAARCLVAAVLFRVVSVSRGGEGPILIGLTRFKWAMLWPRTSRICLVIWLSLEDVHKCFQKRSGLFLHQLVASEVLICSHRRGHMPVLQTKRISQKQWRKVCVLLSTRFPRDSTIWLCLIKVVDLWSFLFACAANAYYVECSGSRVILVEIENCLFWSQQVPSECRADKKQAIISAVWQESSIKTKCLAIFHAGNANVA